MKNIALEDDKNRKELFEATASKVGIRPDAAAFYRDTLVPELNKELSLKLKKSDLVSLDPNDNMVVNFYYPQLFEIDYLRPVVRLEIGPLAEWMPSHITEITPFCAEQYPALFEKKSTNVLTVDIERTFWEKITILHKIANFPDGLEQDVAFKQKFYYSKGAHYETATLGNVMIVPKNEIIDALREDYKAMENMIYGNIPAFDDVVEYMKELESEIHKLEN